MQDQIRCGLDGWGARTLCVLPLQPPMGRSRLGWRSKSAGGT
jgi:hypothetical protein